MACHVLRAGDDSVCEISLEPEVPGKHPRGRPKQRWLDELHGDLKLVGTIRIKRKIGANGVSRSAKRTPPPSGKNPEEEQEG